MRRPDRANEVLSFVRAELDAGRSFPSTRQIGDGVGMDTSAVANKLYRLCELGAVRIADRSRDEAGRWRNRYELVETQP